MRTLVRAAALYNAGGILVLLTPGALGLFGVALPYSPFWVWLSGLMGAFATLVLWLSSRDLDTYGAFAYWNGVIRLTFVIATFALNFGATMGFFAIALAVGDLMLGLGCMLGLPRALGRSHWELLTNARSRARPLEMAEA
jgi:hypothetical protein